MKYLLLWKEADAHTASASFPSKETAAAYAEWLEADGVTDTNTVEMEEEDV